MPDYILIHNDTVKFIGAFQGATVVPKDGVIAGTGAATLGGEKLCVAGDEKKVEITDCVYFTPIHSIPGKGTVKIKALAADQQAKKTQTDGKKVLLVGKFFDAVLEVQQKAKEPPKGAAPPVEDPLTQYMGKGNFVTNNKKYKGA
jgi:hypothetical protein